MAATRQMGIPGLKFEDPRAFESDGLPVWQPTWPGCFAFLQPKPSDRKRRMAASRAHVAEYAEAQKRLHALAEAKHLKDAEGGASPKGDQPDSPSSHVDIHDSACRCHRCVAPSSSSSSTWGLHALAEAKHRKNAEGGASTKGDEPGSPSLHYVNASSSLAACGNFPPRSPPASVDDSTTINPLSTR